MRIRFALFVFCFCVYLLTSGGHTYSTDEETMFFVAAAMARRGGFDIPTDAPVSAGMVGTDGKRYSSYGLAPSAVALPLYHLGARVATLFPLFYNGFFLRLPMTLLLNPLFTALTVVLLYDAARLLGYSFRSSFLVALAFAFGTMAWVYAKTFFSEPLGTLLVFVGFVTLLQYRRAPRLALVAASGVVLGVGVATKVTALVNLPILFGYLLFILYSQRAHLKPRSMILPLGVWGLSAGVLVAAVGAYNLLRFASPFETGYGGGLSLFTLPLWEGLYGLVFSPGKGLFYYSPILLASIPAFWFFWRQHCAEALVCLGIVVINLLLFGVYTIWNGDTSWGPRFLVFILPFMMLPIAALLEYLRDHARRRWYPVLVALGVVSVLLQLLGVTVNFDIYPNSGVTAAERYYHPAQSPLVAHAQLLLGMLTETRPMLPMPEGAIARFGWFFDPANPHPIDFWWLYLIHSGMETRDILLLVVPLGLLCLVGIVWFARVLIARWRAKHL